MNKPVVIDTDILIDVARGISEAAASLQQLEQNECLAISVITQMELLVGCRNKKETNALERFLSKLQVLYINEAISDLAVTLLRKYRLSHGLLIPDALIAATALYNDCSFITKNQRDYRFINGLCLLDYPNF
jgi:predicted nucleic acid-binding protein